jgi:ornithine cyclodeaminase/alanine dehydrogenase-like protein (mu-crystallin family)
MQYFSASAVDAAMPPIDEQLDLAERALRNVGHGSQIPGKVAIHPRAKASFGYAMPAYDPGLGPGNEVLGMKWVTGYPTNSEQGLPAISSLVLLNDPDSLEPVAVLEGSGITGSRTAAVSAVSIRLLAPSVVDRPTTVAIIGAGVQAKAHLAPLGHVVPGMRLVTYDRHADRATELARLARATPGISHATPALSARAATNGADIVITAASFGSTWQVMTPDWLGHNVLVVAVDYETYVSAEIARTATLFLVDEPQGYENMRDEGRFHGYPRAHGTIGDAIIAGTPWPGGHVLVSHLGMGLTDIVFAQAILRRATKLGLGIDLPA